MEFPVLGSQLLVAAVHGVYVLSRKNGVTELFTSGSKGIAAATRTRVQDDILAVADSHIVVLHNFSKGMQRTYRLKESGPPRQLWYDKQNDRLLFTTALENAVQVYSLKSQQFIDPAASHPSPPLLFTVHSSSTLDLLLSASAKPPTIYITALDGDKKRARYLVQPHTWSAVCSAAAFHPAVGPGTDTILFLLGFTDGTIAAYSYNTNDLPEQLASVTKAHITTAETYTPRKARSAGQAGNALPVLSSEKVLPFPDVGETASAVVAICLIPGFLCMGVSVGSDGCCCITDFEPDTGPEIKTRWSLYGAATALAVRKDLIAIGLKTGKMYIYSMTGQQVYSRDFDSHKIVDLEWIDEPIASATADDQVPKRTQPKPRIPIKKDDNATGSPAPRTSRVPSASSTNTVRRVSSQSQKQVVSSRPVSTVSSQAPASPQSLRKVHRLPVSRLNPPVIPPRPSRSPAKLKKNETPASSVKEEDTTSSPIALDGTKDNPVTKKITFADQLPKKDGTALSRRQSISSSEYSSDDYILEWSYEKPSGATITNAKFIKQLPTFNGPVEQDIAPHLSPVSSSSQGRPPFRVSSNPAHNSTSLEQPIPIDFAAVRSAPLKLVTTRHVGDLDLNDGKSSIQPATPRVAEMFGSDTTPTRAPASASKEHSEAKKARMASPQLRNTDTSTPTRARKEGSVELMLTDATPNHSAGTLHRPALQQSFEAEVTCPYCQSTVTPATSSGRASSYVTASSGRSNVLSNLKAELSTEHQKLIREVGTMIASHEQRIHDLLDDFLG